jgi:hypothetical protein
MRFPAGATRLVAPFALYALYALYALFALHALTACGSSAASTTAGGDDAANPASVDAQADGAAAEETRPLDASPDAGSTSEAGACAGCARDWASFPAVAQLDAVPELWVVSDLHGDYAATTKLLAAGGLMSATPATAADAKWTGGKAALVVVGDLIDKGPDAPDVVRLMIALQTSAAAGGGHVVVTMGNHEAEFLADPNNAKATASDGLDPQLATLGLSPAQTAAGGGDLGRFLRNLPIAARVDGWFFAHAGKTDGRSLAKLEADLRSGIDAAGFGAAVLSDPASLLEARLGKTAPQWWDATGDAKALLSQWASALGCKHLVMGHQPVAVGFADGTTRPRDQLMQAFGGLLFLVDTGLSVDVDATGGALLHVRGAGGASETWEAVMPDGSRRAL